MRDVEGGCHCGRIRFRATVDLGQSVVCNCSLCTKKGFIHLIIPPERFQLLSGGGDDISVYRFNTGVAQHQFCRHCGVHPFYVPRSDPDKIDVNARCLDGIDPAELRPAPFDGKNWEAAQAASLAAKAAAAAAAAAQTCGQELSADAEVPDALAVLMRHVAENLDSHARWVGRASHEAAREHDALADIARAYRAISEAAADASARMRAVRDLPAAPHDPARRDAGAFVAWMRRKIELQRAFAELILRHARDSEAVLEEVAVD